MNNYYDHVNSLPDELQDINEKYWNDFGRPVVDHADIYAINDILHISPSFDEFKEKCNIFFFNKYPEDKLILAYSCYVAGIKRIERELKLG